MATRSMLRPPLGVSPCERTTVESMSRLWRLRRLVCAGLVAVAPLVWPTRGWAGEHNSPTDPHAALLVAAGPARCGLFHPVIHVAPSVPLLGFGASSLGWGTAHPHAFSNGGDPSGTVWCITWKHWGAATSYGQGWSEIYGPANTRPIVGIEIRAFDLGHCRSGGHLAYKDLEVKEPTRSGGALTQWAPWSPTGRICPWPRPMIAGH